MLGRNSRVGIGIGRRGANDEDLLAEISEADYLEQRAAAAAAAAKTTTTVVTQVQSANNIDSGGIISGSAKAKVKQHDCGKECEEKYPIHAAIKEGDFTKFKESLEKNRSKHKEPDCQGSTLLHVIAGLDAPGCNELFDHYQQECPNDLWDKEYLDKKDANGRTALHCAALASSPRLIQILLNQGANHYALDEDGEIPLASAVWGSTKEGVEVVEILLNLLNEEDLDKYGPQVLFNAVHSNQCPEVIELLLGRIKFKGIQEETRDEDGDKGFTLLHKSVYWTADDYPIQVECVRKLLAVLDKDDINATCERKGWLGKTALQIAADENSFNVLNELIAHEYTDLFIVDPQKRTILHTLADSGWSVAREQSLSVLFKSPKLNDKATKTKFLDMRDVNGETALEIAIRRDSVAFSRAILLAYPDQPENWIEDTLMKKIYEKVPEIMIPLMNLAIQVDRKNYEAGDELFETDLGPAIGYGLNEEAASFLDDEKSGVFPGFKKETDFLSIILDSAHVKSDERKAVLDHPLVILFIHEKWKKLNTLFWFSFGTNMTLLGLYIFFIVYTFFVTCSYTAVKEGDSGIHCDKPDLWQLIVGCLIVAAQLGLFVVKLTVDFITTGFRNIFNLENFVQLFFTIGVVLLMVMFILVKGTHTWEFWVTSITVLLASFLAFSQLLKIPSLGIYADVFYRVLKKMIRLMITFCPLLIGFTVAISLILPGNPKFGFLPFNLIKILVMMTGEINFDDVFYAEYKTPFRVYAILLYAIFTVIVAIVIFNLLLGFTISDIQTLESESELQILTSTLGQIVVFERLVFSKLSQKLLPKSFLRRYLVVTHKYDPISSREFYRTMEDLPTKLRKSIMELAKVQQQQQPHNASKAGNPRSD